MKRTRRALTVALVALFAVVVTTSTAAALKPVWEYGTTTNKHILKTGETKTTTLTGVELKAVIRTFPGTWLTVRCQSSSGTGTVIGGEPGKGKVTMTFSNCKGVGGNLHTCKLTVFTLENISTELVILADGHTITDNLVIPEGVGAVPFIKIEDEEGHCAGLPRGTYKIWGTLPGAVNGGEALEFPEAPLEEFKLTVSGLLELEEYKDTYTQKLTNGEKLFAELH